MATISWEERKARDALIQKCYTYLNDNFHKFSDTKKLRISLEIIKKRLGAELSLDANVKINKIEVEIKRDGDDKN